MKLSDKTYNELMKTRDVAHGANVLKKYMLNRSNTGSKAKRERIDNFRRELIEAIEIIKKIQNNDLLTIFLSFDENELIGALKYLQDLEKRKKSKRIRIVKYYHINWWMGVLILSLHQEGLEVAARREDFLFKFISENNLENYKFTEMSKEDEEYQIQYAYKMNEQSIRRIIRKIDKNIRHLI